MKNEDGDLPVHPIYSGTECLDQGLNLRDYFIAHAPAEPQGWFQPVMDSERPEPCWGDARPDDDYPINSGAIAAWDREKVRQKYIQWPAAWADAMLEQRRK